MIFRLRSGAFQFILLLGLLNAGCGSQLPYFGQVSPLPSSSVCRVAVLPFMNDSEYPLADAIVEKVFSAQLQEASDYFVVQEGDVHKVYQELHILPGHIPTSREMQIIADRLSAQLLITGVVLEMREDPGEHHTVDPIVVVEVRIRDGRTGETLWKTYHRRQGTEYRKTMHFGTIHTVTGLSRQVAVEIINLWLKKGLTQCTVSSQF